MMLHKKFKVEEKAILVEPLPELLSVKEGNCYGKQKEKGKTENTVRIVFSVIAGVLVAPWMIAKKLVSLIPGEKVGEE